MSLIPKDSAFFNFSGPILSPANTKLVFLEIEPEFCLRVVQSFLCIALGYVWQIRHLSQKLGLLVYRCRLVAVLRLVQIVIKQHA